MISKKELQEINKKQNLGLTDADIDIMVNFVSKDKQKIKQKDLYEFLKNWYAYALILSVQARIMSMKAAGRWKQAGLARVGL